MTGDETSGRAWASWESRRVTDGVVRASDRSMKASKKSKQEWHAMLPGGLAPALFSLEELRAAKGTHAYLTEKILAPEPIADGIRAFRFLTFFGIACVAEDKYPSLTRCWKHLESLFIRDPVFEDGVFIQS